ncbi:MAG: CCA tRNA nucleotidyltransferase, partial [Planctomycetota bacterium]|nr:CCA tRNA nucleotidyltransferase [Planctomycetota bacterium]
SGELMAARMVAARLKEKGHKAFFAGGCVRDMLLGRPISDYDIATSAKPKDVQKLFRRTLKVGVQFGIVIAIVDGYQIEIATFRSDGQYLDGRRPENVIFSSPEEDAARRDFTINGLFYDPQEQQLFDYVGGQEDLWRGQIRAIGEAKARILEDHLRLLRAVRFSARFGFPVEEKTRLAVEEHSHLICKVSPERIKDELGKILKEPTRAQGLTPLLDFGLLKAIDMSLYADVEARRKETQSQLDLLPKKAPEPVVWAAFLGKGKLAERMLRQLKASNELREKTAAILFHAEDYADYRKLSLSKRKRLLRRKDQSDHFLYAWSLALAKDGDLRNVMAAADDRKAFGEAGDGSLFAELIVRGHDLIALGLKPGRAFKKMLQVSEDAQLEGNSDKESLIQLLKDQFADQFVG